MSSNIPVERALCSPAKQLTDEEARPAVVQYASDTDQDRKEHNLDVIPGPIANNGEISSPPSCDSVDICFTSSWDDCCEVRHPTPHYTVDSQFALNDQQISDWPADAEQPSVHRMNLCKKEKSSIVIPCDTFSELELMEGHHRVERHHSCPEAGDIEKDACPPWSSCHTEMLAGWREDCITSRLILLDYLQFR